MGICGLALWLVMECWHRAIGVEAPSSRLHHGLRNDFRVRRRFQRGLLSSDARSVQADGLAATMLREDRVGCALAR